MPSPPWVCEVRPVHDRRGSRDLRTRCATDIGGLHRALGLLFWSLVGCLAIEAAVGSVEVVEVLPLLELVFEQFRVVDDDTVEHPLELLLVDPMRSLDFAVEARGGGFDVNVADAAIEDVVVELGAEFAAVVCLDGINPGTAAEPIGSRGTG